MHIDFELEFKTSSRAQIRLCYCTAATVSLVISSAALWPSSLPCHLSIFLGITRIALEGISCNNILENTLTACRENSNIIKWGQKVMITVLEDRCTLFDQISIKTSWNDIFPNRIVQKTSHIYSG